MVGPAVAGTLVALIGAGGAIAVDGATFLVSAAFLATLRVPAIVKTDAAHGFFVELRKGWREVKSRTWLWVMLLRVCLVLFIVIAVPGTRSSRSSLRRATVPPRGAGCRRRSAPG